MLDNFFKAVWESCTSFSFYRRVTGLSFLQCLKYIVPFSLLAGALLYSSPGLELFRTSRRLQEWAGEKLPEMRIEEGKLSVDATQPCYLEPAGIVVPIGEEGQTRNLRLAFDTTGQLTSLDQTDGADVLFLKDKMIVGDLDGEVKEIPFTDVWLFTRYHTITVNADNVRRYLPVITWAMIILPFLVTVVAKPVQALIFSVIGLLLSTREGKSAIDFRGAYNISLFATIPATIVSIAVHLSGLFFPYLWVLYIVVTTAFIIGAISAIRRQA